MSYPLKLLPEERTALVWYVRLITEAEMEAKNPAAVQNPGAYGQAMVKQIWKRPEAIPRIVAEWRLTLAEGKLNQPLWPGTKKHEIRNVLEATAA